MKLKNNFILHKNNDQYMMVGVGCGFNGMIRSNATAGKIIELLKDGCTESELVTKMCDLYDAPEEVIARDVASVLASLREVGAIDE